MKPFLRFAFLGAFCFPVGNRSQSAVPYLVEEIRVVFENGFRAANFPGSLSEAGELAGSVLYPADPNFPERPALYDVDRARLTVLDFRGSVDSLRAELRGVSLRNEVPWKPGLIRSGDSTQFFSLAPLLFAPGYGAGFVPRLSSNYALVLLNEGYWFAFESQLCDLDSLGCVLIPGGTQAFPFNHAHDMVQLADGSPIVTGNRTYRPPSAFGGESFQEGYVWRLGDSQLTALPKPPGVLEVAPLRVNAAGEIAAKGSGGELLLYDPQLNPQRILLPNGASLDRIAALDSFGNIAGNYFSNANEEDSHAFLSKANGEFLDLSQLLAPVAPIGRVLHMNDRGQLIVASPDAQTLYVLYPKNGRPGDMNGDGEVNGFDIESFVEALTNREDYGNKFPDSLANGDVNGDGRFDGFDIGPFWGLLTGN